jgi:hypothetical protein
MPKRSSRGQGKARAAARVEAVADVASAAPAIIPSSTLSDALEAVVAQSQHRASIEAVAGSGGRPLRQPVPSGWLAAALGGWGVVALLQVTQPAAVRGPEDRPWTPAPSLADASLRYGLWLADARVEAFLEANGRLPSFLEETGLADSSLTLTATGERTYRLEGRQGTLRLELSSGMAADSFLGASLETLRR